MLNFTTSNTFLVFQAQPVSDELYMDNVTIIITVTNQFGIGIPSEAIKDTVCK